MKIKEKLRQLKEKAAQELEDAESVPKENHDSPASPERPVTPELSCPPPPTPVTQSDQMSEPVEESRPEIRIPSVEDLRPPVLEQPAHVCRHQDGRVRHKVITLALYGTNLTLLKIAS